MNKDQNDDEATMPPATRSKYRYAMIIGIFVIVLAVAAVVIIGAMVS